MILRWLRHRRRAKLRLLPFPTEWETVLRDNVRLARQLSEPEQRKLRHDIQILVSEKHWEGCGGLTLTDEIKVTIAAQACLLVLAFEDEYFDLVQSILVYPNAYVAPGRTITRAGVVLEGDSHREGEAWYRGPVILSWADALAGGRNQTDGENLVLHEFAHQLDMQDGREADGTPPLNSAQQYERWNQVVDQQFEKLARACESGVPTLLNCYGATNRGEFFAVATECFFERPRELAHYHPALYEILQAFYRQHPAARV